MKDFCTVCNKKTEHKKGKLHQKIQVYGQTIEGDVYGYICTECGEDGIITDSRELDRKYAETFKAYHNGMLSGEQIESIREKEGMTVKEFVKYLKNNKFGYTPDEYREIEDGTLVQSGELEKFLRKTAGMPEWSGYK